VNIVSVDIMKFDLLSTRAVNLLYLIKGIPLGTISNITKKFGPSKKISQSYPAKKFHKVTCQNFEFPSGIQNIIFWKVGVCAPKKCPFGLIKVS